MNIKVGSQPRIVRSWSQCYAAIQRSRSNYFSDRITNLQKTTINGTASGQQSTDSTTLSEVLRGAGFENLARQCETTGYLNIPKPWIIDPSGDHTPVPYPDNNPKTAFGAKKLPLELVPPSAVHALAEAFADGAKKYGPYNWREKSISSSIYYGAALRHLQSWWDGEDLAEDSGINHLHHALACIAMLIDGGSVGKLNDNRPPKGAASSMQKKWLENHKDSPNNVPKLNELNNG